MCFSAEVSFGASVVITTVGIVAYKKAKQKPYRLLALISIFFGIQQFFEGVVWLATRYDQFSGLLDISTYGYVFFAWVLWPFFIPFVFWKLEKEDIRKKILLGITLTGLVMVMVLLYIMVFGNVTAQVLDCSLVYTNSFYNSPGIIASVLYVLCTAVSNFISSTGKVWVLGVINVITYFGTQIYFEGRLLSIWCFFAALSSIVILLIILDLNKKERIEESQN